jgi:hypothetical protein
LLASWWLVCSNSDENLDQMDETTKRLMMSHVKSSWDSRRRFCADPPEWLDTLPGAPLQLLQQYPDTFRVAFGSSSEGGPIPYPMDLTKLLAFDQTYGCRGGVRHVPAAVAGPRRALARQPSETGPAERMANVFMSRMENIFSSMMNSGANNGGPCMGRGLSALANSSDLSRRMPTIGFGPPFGEQLALVAPPMLQVPAPAAYQQPGAAAPPQASVQPSAAALSLELAITAASESPEYEAGDELAGMLDMLSARDVAKKTAAKAAAKAAAIAAKAAPESESDVALVAAPAAPKAKAAAKVKAAAPKVKAAVATVKAAAATVKAAAAKAPPAPPAAAAKAAPAAKVKAAAAKAPPAPPKAAAKAKAKAKGKAAAKAAGAVAAVLGDGIKLGCPKCRSALIKVNQDVPECSPNVPQCYANVIRLFISVFQMFSKCSPNVFQMFFSVLQMSPHVLQMFSTCSSVFSKCFPNVLQCFLPRRVHKVEGTRWFCGESFVHSYHNARSHTADHNARSHTADHNARSHTTDHNARSQSADHNTRSVFISIYILYIDV